MLFACFSFGSSSTSQNLQGSDSLRLAQELNESKSGLVLVYWDTEHLRIGQPRIFLTE